MKRQKVCIGIILILAFLPFYASSMEKVSSSIKELNENTLYIINQGRYHEAYALAIKAKERAKAEKKNTEYARALHNQATCLHLLGDNYKALNLYNEALLISKKEGDKHVSYRIINAIANVYNLLGKHQEALDYQLKLKLLFDKDARPIKELNTNISLSHTYLLMNGLTKAKHYIELSKRLFGKSPDVFMGIYMHLAETELLVKEKEYSKALNLYDSIIKIAKESGYNGLVIAGSLSKAKLLYNMRLIEEAMFLAKQGIAFAEQQEFSYKLAEGYELLIKIYLFKKDYKEAYEISEKLKTLRSKISGEKVQALGEITRIERQVAETEEALRQSQKDQQILMLQLGQQKQQQIIWIAAFVAFFILIFFWFYRRNSQKQLLREKRLNNELIELDKVKDRVLTNTSHELRTPLNGIIGLSEVMLQGDSDNMTDSMRSSIKLIQSSGEQLALVVNDILDLAQIKSDRFTPKLSQFNLTTLVSEVISVCQPLADKKGIDLVVDNYLTEVQIVSDHSRLRQILFNVVGNAIKFTAQGYVQIQLDNVEGEVNITVSDTGIGIPEANLERVFKGFEQVNSGDSRAEQGSGLGLAISRGLAEALGGSLTLHSVLGDGTQVNINLPINAKE